MKRKLFGLLSLAVAASMLLAACAPAAPTAAPQVEEPTQAAEATAAPAEETVAPAEPTTAPEPAEAPKSDRKGAWLDKVIFSAIPEVGPAVEQLKAGAIDMWANTSEDAIVFEDVKSDPNLKYAQSFGSSDQLLFNTTACTDPKKFNPFSVAKIREAMNWATDRNYIAQEIMGGLGAPKYTAITTVFADYARFADTFAAIETKYAYNMEKAQEVVAAEMEAAGFTKNADGKWEKDGAPATVIGLIRVEDERKEIGNYFANQLEALGFTVERQEKTSKEAAPIWQSDDPANCSFNFYTAGWIAQVISRDETNMFIQYNTGQLQNLPVMNNYQPSERLLDLSTRLFATDYSSMDERAEMFIEALNLSMEESWWGVWIADAISFSPYSASVVGPYDLASGFSSSQLFPFTVRKEGQEGGELHIAHQNIMGSPYNPIAGGNWNYDGMIQHFAMDWGLVYNPYTGLTMPKLVQKAEVVAQEGLPIANNSEDWLTLSFEKEITVPEDAWADWDPVAQKFITVKEKFPEGVTSKTKTVVIYRPELWDTTWHDGSKMSIADFVFHMITTFDGGKKDSKAYDASLEPGLESFLSHFKGVRITSTDPLTIETYDDQYSLDAELTLSDWYPGRYIPATSTNGMQPWHGLTPAYMAEENGELSFSTDKAGEKKIEWTSFIAGPSLEVQAKYLDQAIADKYIPFAPTMSEYLTADEAVARYENLKKFYQAHNHIFIGTGAYYVDQVFPVEGSIVLARYPEYIFPADEFAGIAEPKMIEGEVTGPLSIKAGEEATFDVAVTNNGEAYPAAEIEKVSFILFDANKEVVGKGEATLVADGQYQVVLPADLTSKLEAGGSKVLVAISSAVVSIPAFVNYEFVVE